MALTVEPDVVTGDARTLLERVKLALPIMADLSRSDLLIYQAIDAERAVVVAHARPHSVSPIYQQDRTGRAVSRRDEPVVMRVLRHRPTGGDSGQAYRNAPIKQNVWPIRTPAGHVAAALSVETTVVEVERHNKRSPIFQNALQDLIQQLIHGQIDGAEHLSSFGEHDGIVFVDEKKQVRYVSGVAENLYRKLGHAESVLRHSISSLGTDEGTYFAALESGRCQEAETREGQLIWIRKAIPVSDVRGEAADGGDESHAALKGVLLTLSDVTEQRRREQELRVKAAMIQEIHHRVKNNLQTIASLLRIQSRRVEDAAARQQLEEGVNRILSVAVVHEFLSHDETHVISIREVAQRIVNHTMKGILDPSKGINLALRGGGFSLVAQQATACALVINELVQNAVEHGYSDRNGGTIIVNLMQDGEDAVIEIADDGEGLPPNFDLDRSTNLGLKIVQTLVREDLKGTFELRDSYANDRGVSAVVRFPRLPVPQEAEQAEAVSRG